MLTSNLEWRKNPNTDSLTAKAIWDTWINKATNSPGCRKSKVVLRRDRFQWDTSQLLMMLPSMESLQITWGFTRIHYTCRPTKPKSRGNAITPERTSHITSEGWWVCEVYIYLHLPWTVIHSASLWFSQRLPGKSVQSDHRCGTCVANGRCKSTESVPTMAGRKAKGVWQI